MFSIHTRSMDSIHSFIAAKCHYERTQHPRARSRGDLLFKENERPLDGERRPHKRLVRNADGSFGVVLYETEMIRYYPPAEDGSKRVKLYHHGSVSSDAFMWRHGFRYPGETYTSTDLVPTRVPLIGNVYHDDGYWAADLVFNARSQLDIERSWHAPIEKIVTTPARRKERKEVAKCFAHLLHFAKQVPDRQWAPEPRHAIEAMFYRGSKDPVHEAEVMQYLLFQHNEDMLSALCRALHLHLRDGHVPLPMFMPGADAPNWRQLKRDCRVAG